MECDVTVIEKQLRHCCAELERRLRRGEISRAEEFFSACPELTEDAETALDLIYREFVVRSELGPPPVADEYYQRFPQWREPLCHQFQVHKLLGDEAPQRAVDADEPTPWPRDMTPPRPWKNNPPDFEVLEEISRGSMGVVYRAWQKSVRRVVALKIVLARALSSPGDLARFRQEAEATGRLVHPNIVQIFRIDEWEHCPFLVLEYVEGHTLADHWTGGPQPANDTAALVLTLANAVQFAHERGVVHRDLRSGNVLLTKEGAPKIIDFGLAKLMLADDQLTFPGQVLGTPSYMAPEQAAGRNSDVGPAVDLYSLGAILYEGMTGRPPFRGETILDTLNQVIEREPVSPRSLQPRAPRDLETICLKCLQKAPERRYASAAELAEDLRRFLAGEPIQARRVHAFERLWRWCARNPAIANLLLALFAALVIGFSLDVWKWRQESQARIDVDQAQQDALREQLIARMEKLKAERLSAGIVFEQAIKVGDHGNIDHAMLLLGQCLQQAAANED